MKKISIAKVTLEALAISFCSSVSLCKIKPQNHDYWLSNDLCNLWSAFATLIPSRLVRKIFYFDSHSLANNACHFFHHFAYCEMLLHKGLYPNSQYPNFFYCHVFDKQHYADIHKHYADSLPINTRYTDTLHK